MRKRRGKRVRRCRSETREREAERTENEDDHDSLLGSFSKESSKLVVRLTDSIGKKGRESQHGLSLERRTSRKKSNEPVGEDDLQLPQLRGSRRGGSSSLSSLSEDCERSLDEEEDVGGLETKRKR